MPYLHVHTNVSVTDPTGFMQRCSREVSAALGKPESYVMIELSDGKPMQFAGSGAPLAFVELTSLGLQGAQTADVSAMLCALLGKLLDVPASRIYIAFGSPERVMFGWNGGTF